MYIYIYIYILHIRKYNKTNITRPLSSSENNKMEKKMLAMMKEVISTSRGRSATHSS